MNIKVYELDIKIYLMKNINSAKSHEFISELIDKYLSQNEKYLKLHIKNDFKYYCFNNLYPIEKDFTFKEGNIYTFRIRTIDKDIAEYFAKTLFNGYTNTIKVLGVTTKVIPQKHLDNVTAITPIIMKFECGYWRGKEKISEVEKRIKNNLIKKYNRYYNENISDDFELFLTFNFKNKKPIPSNYKDIVLLGDKMEFKVSNTPIAQKLLYFALGTGLGELNARGFGFMNYSWM